MSTPKRPIECLPPVTHRIEIHDRIGGGSESVTFDSNGTYDPVLPPTARQLAARRKFLDEHCDAGDIVLPPVHRHEDDLCSRLLKGGGQ